MTHLSDITTGDDLLRKMRDLLAAIRREAGRAQTGVKCLSCPSGVGRWSRMR